jgi:hypothetical protein
VTHQVPHPYGTTGKIIVLYTAIFTANRIIKYMTHNIFIQTIQMHKKYKPTGETSGSE